jgi:hypothetical protein
MTKNWFLSGATRDVLSSSHHLLSALRVLAMKILVRSSICRDGLRRPSHPTKFNFPATFHSIIDDSVDSILLLYVHHVDALVLHGLPSSSNGPGLLHAWKHQSVKILKILHRPLYISMAVSSIDMMHAVNEGSCQDAA